MIHCDLCNVRPHSCSGPHFASLPILAFTINCQCRWAHALWEGMLQANFAGDAQYKQHLDGPIHRKALAKAEAERQRDLQLGANKGAAESALVRAPTVNHHVIPFDHDCLQRAAPGMLGTHHSDFRSAPHCIMHHDLLHA